MAALADFELAIAQLTDGQATEKPAGLVKAADRLIEQICGQSWQTPGEREKAQGLVTRLCVIRAKASLPNSHS